MNNLIIIGARGFGREAYNAFLKIYGNKSDWHCKGFLDSDKTVLDGYKGYPPIIGAPEDYEIEDSDCFFCAMGDVFWRKHYVDILKRKDAKFISLISPSAEIGLNTEIGEGCFIAPYVFVSCDVHIGNHTFLFRTANIGHDVFIDDFCHLGANSVMGGYSHLYSLVTLHPGAEVLPHKIVESGAIVGAGSVVIRNVREKTTVMGVPAIKVKY